MHRINLKSITLSKQWVAETSNLRNKERCEQDYSLKFLLEDIFRTRNMGTLLLTFLFLVMLFWNVRSAWHHAANPDDLVASNSFSASQVEAIDIEILLSGQGSRIVNTEKSSIVHSFLVRAHNLQILRIEQGSTPRSIETICYAYLCCHRKQKNRCTLSFSRFASHYGRLFRPLSPSSSESRSNNALTLLYPRFLQPFSRRRDRVSWPCWAPCCLHPIPDWVNWPLLPRNDYKMEPFTGTADTKAPSPSELGIITVLVLLLASLATCH
jgi:hypothetical protein